MEEVRHARWCLGIERRSCAIGVFHEGRQWDVLSVRGHDWATEGHTDEPEYREN